MILNYQERTIGILTDSVVPAIKMNFNLTLEYNEIPVNITAELLSEDNKFLANLSRIGRSQNSSVVKVVQVFFNTDMPQANQSEYAYEMVAQLSKESLDYIEKTRERNKKKDVVFRIRTVVEYFKVVIELGNFQRNRIQGHNPPQDAVTFPTGNQTADPAIRILTSPSNTYPFSISKYVPKDFPITIPSSDWISDFQVPLGIGRFMLIDVPLISFEEVAALSGIGDFKILIERINKAKEVLETMEKYLREGEWNLVVSKSREFFELFAKEVKGKIKELIQESTGLEEEPATKLTTAFDNLEDYSSALHHSVKKDGKPVDIYTGGKEDAYLVFYLCVSILNLVSKKVYSKVG